MDSRIEKLKSSTFCGTQLTRRQIADLQKTVEMFPALSRHELAATLCSHLGWFTPKGRDRDRAKRLKGVVSRAIAFGNVLTSTC